MSIQPYPAWDFQVILALQHHLASWVPFLKGVSIVLSPPVYFAIAMILYFLDHKKGVQSLIFLALATFLALALKDIVHHPRPFWTSPFILGYIHPRDYGMPSGHALFSVYLLFLAFLYRRLWGISLAIIAIFLVCLSRMVLGAHFVEQILVGLVLGGICWALTPSFFQLLRSRRLTPRGILAILVLIFLVILVGFSFLFFQWGMYFQPLPEWQALYSQGQTQTLRTASFFPIGVSYLFCMGIFIALFLEETTLKIQSVHWKSVTFSNFFLLCLLLGVYILSTVVIFLLLYFISHTVATVLLAFWIPFFFCYIFPVELVYLNFLTATSMNKISRARKFSMAYRISRSL